MRKKLLMGALAVSTLTLTSLIQANSAEALVFGFKNISATSVTNADIGESQLQVDVTDDGIGGVNFKFENLGTGQSAISEIYFDDRMSALTLPATLSLGTGVKFTAGAASPGNLPAANQATPAFNVTAGFLADADNPAPKNGINNTTNSPNLSEFLTINYMLGNSVTFNQLINAISKPDFRIGLHVIGFANGGSESFITDTPVVPTPAAVLPALVGMGVAAVRKKGKGSVATEEA